MRILLDESAPRGLRQLLGRHDVRTVQDQGWQGNENGDLLALASEDFDVFITPDQNLPHQQAISDFDIAVTYSLPSRIEWLHTNLWLTRSVKQLNVLSPVL